MYQKIDVPRELQYAIKGYGNATCYRVHLKKGGIEKQGGPLLRRSYI